MKDGMPEDAWRETWTIRVGPAGTEREETVDVAIDLRWLVAQVGGQAVRNRTGRSQALAGAIVVRHRRPKAEPGRPLIDVLTDGEESDPEK
jgi:hypothetical protein